MHIKNAGLKDKNIETKIKNKIRRYEMKRFRFGFIQMHDGFDPEKQQAQFANGEDKTYIVGVDNLEQACRVAQKWAEEGLVDMIELCGAFGEKGAEQVNRAAGDKLPIGYAVHSPSQNAKYEALFGKHD